MLTGNKTLNIEILNLLNDKDLVSFCLSNKDANKICNDETFWQRRTIQKYDKYISVEMMRKYKKDKWSDYYIELNKIDKYPSYEMAKSMELGRKDIETILRKKYPNINIIFLQSPDIEYYTDINHKSFAPISQGKFKSKKNNITKIEGDLIDGIKVGKWVEYYSDGMVKLISNYKKNSKELILDGEQIIYDPDGNVYLYEVWSNNALQKDE